jgi:hypothetical protein
MPENVTVSAPPHRGDIRIRSPARVTSVETIDINAA